MMKKLFTFFILISIASLVLAQNNPGFFELRLTDPGGMPNVMHVQMRALSSTVPTTDNFCTDLGFRLHWNTAAISSIDMVQSTSIGSSLNEQAVVPGSGNNKTQTVGFCGACSFFNFPSNWTLNVWVNIGTININGTGSAIDFDLVAFDGQFPNLGVDFVEHTPNAAPLPLTLLSFTAEKFGTQSASLEWVTTNESNTSHFSVERSFDKIHWEKVGSLQAAGYSLGIEHYSFEDVDVYNGKDSRLNVYYRLNMIDLDDKQAYSPVRSVVFTNTTSITSREILAYPNPSSQGIQIEWSSELLDQPTKLEFYDLKGKLVYSADVAENTYQEYIDFSRTSIIPGLYLLRILSNDQTIDHKQIVVDRR